MIGISLDTDLKALRDVLIQKGITWPQICDGQAFKSDLAKLFNVHGTPKFFLLDRDSRIVRVYEGEQGREIPKLRKAIAELVATK